jgi:hypothetical protein
MMKILEREDMAVVGESPVATAVRWKDCPHKDAKVKSCVIVMFNHPKKNCDFFGHDKENIFCKKEPENDAA